VIWPDSVLKLAKAIAVAEGSNPEWNNPGDLTGKDAGSFRTCGVANKEGVLKFVNADDGWSALHIKVHRMLSGNSAVYPLTLTLEQVGLKYSGGDANWSRNVANYLGVPETITLQQLAEK
jgi:hypothetical protein